MTERMLITKLVRTDENRADLYGKDRLYKDFTLFNLSDLADVGIDYASLETGVETPCRFWCIYELSDKLNKAGNPYKDIVALEPIDKPATTTSTDTSSLLEAIRDLTSEVKAIKGMLVYFLDTTPALVAAPSESSRDPEPAPVAEARVDPDPDVASANAFYALASQAIADGLPQSTIDEILAEAASTHGFVLARECLAAENPRRPGPDYDHRLAIIARLKELTAMPLVTTGQVPHRLDPGWQWTYTKAQLLKEGKRLKTALEAAGG